MSALKVADLLIVSQTNVKGLVSGSGASWLSLSLSLLSLSLPLDLYIDIYILELVFSRLTKSLSLD